MNFYKEKKLTVLLNTSGAVLTIPVKTLSGRVVVLHPRKGRAYVDIEDICDSKQIRAAKMELEEMTIAGKLAWHPKGSRPVSVPSVPPMRLPQAEGEFVTAPPNVYDEKINEQIEKEKREDEKSKASSTARNLTRQTAPKPISAREPAPDPARLASQATQQPVHPNQTRQADASKGEVDAGMTGGPGTRATRGADAAKGEIDGAQIPQDPPGTSDKRRVTETPSPWDTMQVGELVDAALEAGVLVKKGSYIQLEGVNIANGKKNTCAILETDAGLLNRVRLAMRQVAEGN